MSPRQLVNVARNQTMFDVELGGTTLSSEIVRILRRAEYSGIDSWTDRTRRQVISSVGKCLSPRVADEGRQSGRESFLQATLQRMIGRKFSVLHPLDIAESWVWTWTG